LRDAVVLYRKLGTATRQRVDALLGLGEIQQRKQDLPETEKLYREALDVAYKVNTRAPHNMIGFADRLSALLVERKDFDEADAVPAPPPRPWPTSPLPPPSARLGTICFSPWLTANSATHPRPAPAASAPQPA